MAQSGMDRVIQIPIDGDHLEGMLQIPENALGVVLFAHGSGSSRHSSRNNFVAKQIRTAGLGTLLFDLLTLQEDQDYETRFNIPLLTERLITATRWLETQDLPATARLGYFGASTGAAAALDAAAELGGRIEAVVSRGGRPDLAVALPDVSAPTLLLVGGYDEVVIQLNRQAYRQLACEKQLIIVPGATHLFEEPGTLEQVAHYATDWFQRFLAGAAVR